MKTEIRSFLNRSFQNLDVEDGEDIFAIGIVNSLFAMQLVMFVEKTFLIEVADDDLNLDNFRSVNAIADLVQRKTA
jgi:acyl carrier protein